MRLLLAVADPALRRPWVALAAERGFEVHRALPGPGAWQACRTLAPDLIVLECAPGSPDALELCRRIRRQPAAPRPGIVLLLPADRADQLAAALEAGADDVLLGPPDPAVARARLKALETRRRPHAAAPTARELAGFQWDQREERAASAAATDDEPEPDARAAIEPPADLADPAPPRPAAVTPATRHEPLADPVGDPVDDPVADPRPLVLLVDDEAAVRRPLRQALELGGCRVLEAADGLAGLDLHARWGSAIALAVVDHPLPGLSGLEVLAELRRRAPALPVVLLSAYAAAELAAGGGPAADAVLRKPYELGELAATVRRQLPRLITT